MYSTINKKNGRSFARVLPALMAITIFSGCNKLDDVWQHHPGKPGSPSSFGSEVIEKWMNLQLRLMKNTTGVPNQAFSRHYAYSGIAAWESVAPGVAGSQQYTKKWNGLTGLPQASSNIKYYWPASVNASLAAINRSLFPNASAGDKASIDSLEQTLNENFLKTSPADRIKAAADFGKSVATAVYSWSETDGYKNASRAYTPPVGDGKWKPTPPTNAAASTPYWGENRTVVIGSLTNAAAPAPLAYSTDPGSPFYLMVKKVHDASQTLTQQQKDMAIFWRDVPGVTSPGHWVSVLLQTLQSKKTSLAKAALAYALSGAAVNDALIGCFQAKYTYNLVRPITYIRDVIGDAGWNSYLNTPPHPEYPSAHSSLSAGAAVVLQSLFPEVHSIVDHTYDYMGFAPRSYNDFHSIAIEAGISRLYAGIHYQPSIDAGLVQGKKAAENILKASLPSNFTIE
ncbi:vanadium-dependent haloperoxidase [Paraflavitalea sp. CAU 1676]|uniref:vanadium-dependent haloperoxidase n=1 Tax=Paraflavitalea sp. CAU 1676 TaxID=3032598 RepID=UPI0023DCD5A0|nr:vanadium-dependent haloperoxidase [Paraflavitalea sp. CAU 1676]MDF2187311.1 vanadium-dependent haloperoxidase [Paraflavitalea sp. CAU 1676]